VEAFRIARLSFELEALDPISLPSYKGSTFRGGFGHAFKKSSCALRLRECDSCLLREKCAYSYVFETPPPSDTAIMRKYPRAPHPFVLEPPEEERSLYRPGEPIVFGLTLIGRAIEYLPYFIYSFNLLGEMGMGRGKGRFTLKRVRALTHPPASQTTAERREHAPPIYDGESKKLNMVPLSVAWQDLLEERPPPPDDRITVSFRTPTRIRYNGRLTLELEFHVLIRNLLRRISTLSYFHCGESLEVDFRSLIERAEGIVSEDRHLRWHDWERYSGRQDTRLKMGGFVGSVSFRGDVESFWPYLVLGRAVHVGKGTAFGLGRYEISGS